MTPRVSVVLPAFNAAATVGHALASIRDQSLAEWELIAVDDGSTDGTGVVLEEWARREPRLRVLHQPHRGVAAAANAGVAAARAGLLARLDADDVALPGRLARQLAFLEDPANRGIGVVSCLVEFGGERAASHGYALHVDWLNALDTPEAVARQRFVESPVANPSVMFRRELWDRHGGFRDGDFPEDYELWLRWLDAGVRVGKVPEVLLRWNDPPTRLSRTDSRYAPEAFFRLKAPWIARELARMAERRGGPRPVLVWGAGRHTRRRASHLLEQGVALAGYIDVDVKKTGRGVGGTGLPVLAEEAVPPPGRAFVLGYVTSRGARDYIRRSLERRGHVEGEDFLLCA